MGKQKPGGISWCDWTVNPIRAHLGDRIGHYCEKIGPECKHCYASKLQLRFGMPEFHWNNDPAGTPEGIQHFLIDKQLYSPLRRRVPTRYFWGDMTDLFGHWVKTDWINRCLSVMALTPQHTHMLLTKRADRMLQYFTEPDIREMIYDRAFDLAHNIYWDTARLAELSEITNWPIPNTYLGVTAGTQAAADDRREPMNKLAHMGWKTFVSAEPLLEDINFHLAKPCDRDCNEYQNSECPGGTGLCGGEWKLNWVICGGESGSHARPTDPTWVRGIRDQCQAAGVPFHFKQWGEWAECGPLQSDPDFLGGAWFDSAGGGMTAVAMLNSASGRYHRFGDGKIMERVGKKAAGRMLDGRTWLEFPKEITN